jgi:hypothetical protein
MLSDDTFRAYFDRTAAALTAWRGHVIDVAACAVVIENRVLRLALRPKTPLACSCELLLYPQQTYDIAIGPEVYEDVTLDGREDFLPLLTALTDGRVVTRRNVSAVTGRLVSIDTIVSIAGGREWRRGRMIAAPDEETIARDHHYLPYRRI